MSRLKAELIQSGMPNLKQQHQPIKNGSKSFQQFLVNQVNQIPPNVGKEETAVLSQLVDFPDAEENNTAVINQLMDLLKSGKDNTAIINQLMDLPNVNEELIELVKLFEKLEDQTDGAEADLLVAFEALFQTQPAVVKELIRRLPLAQEKGLEGLLQKQPLLNQSEQELLNELKIALTQIKASHNQTRQNRNDYLINSFKRNFVPQITNEHSAVANPVTVTDTITSSHTQGIGHMLPMSKTQQFVLFVDGNQGQSPYTQEKFIKDFQTIIAKSQLNMANGQSKLLIKLYPEHLGSLHIELLHQDNGIIAKILTSTASAKDMLESQIQQLKHTFQAQNIPVEKIDISQQLMQNFEKPLYQGQNKEQREQRDQQQKHQNEPENEQSSVSFEEELLNFQV